MAAHDEEQLLVGCRVARVMGFNDHVTSGGPVHTLAPKAVMPRWRRTGR